MHFTDFSIIYRLAVLGPSAAASNVLEKQSPKSPVVTVSATSGKVTVSSAAMAAAVVAAHGSNWRPVISSENHQNLTSSSSKNQPPYSPRSALLSPVKFGDQLQPQLKAVAPPSGSSYTSYRLPSYSRDNLIDKLRQVI